MIYSSCYTSPLGKITLAADHTALLGAWIKDQRYFGGTTSISMTPTDHLPIFEKTKDWFNRYFAGEKPSLLELSLAPRGGAFRQEVWKILCDIPYGTVTTYGEIAQQMARKMNKSRMSAQAIGGAVGHNPISIIIPCHRVIGAKGNLTGYAGGLEKKQWLLAHEGVEFKQKTFR